MYRIHVICIILLPLHCLYYLFALSMSRSVSLEGVLYEIEREAVTSEPRGDTMKGIEICRSDVRVQI